MGAEVAEVELGEFREAIAQAQIVEQKAAAKRSIAFAMNMKGEGCIEEMQKALHVGQLAGLETSELAVCEQAIKAAEAAHSEAEAAAEEAAMEAKLTEKQEAAEEAARSRSFSSYFFGDPEVDSKEQEAEEAERMLQAAQQRRRKSLASLQAAQTQLEAAKETAEAMNIDPTVQGA